MAPTTAVSVDSTLGLAFIGFAGACAFYGILCSQCYMYYCRYPSDRREYKALVALIWICETLDQVFIGHSVYYYCITQYSNPIPFLTQPPIWSVFTQIFLGAIVGFIVKLAFASRVWTFSSRNFWITALIVLLAIGQLSIATILTVQSFLSNDTLLEQLEEFKVIGSFSLGTGVVTDVVIAAALCFYLQRIRRSSQRADSMARALMRHALDTGILTSAFSLTTLIAFRVNPNNFTFLCFYFLVSKLYATTFLAALNTRMKLKEAEDNAPPPAHTGGTTFMPGHGSMSFDSAMQESMSMKVWAPLGSTHSNTYPVLLPIPE